MSKVHVKYLNKENLPEINKKLRYYLKKALKVDIYDTPQFSCYLLNVKFDDFKITEKEITFYVNGIETGSLYLFDGEPIVIEIKEDEESGAFFYIRNEN